MRHLFGRLLTYIETILKGFKKYFRTNFSVPTRPYNICHFSQGSLELIPIQLYSFFFSTRNAIKSIVLQQLSLKVILLRLVCKQIKELLFLPELQFWKKKKMFAYFFFAKQVRRKNNFLSFSFIWKILYALGQCFSTARTRPGTATWMPLPGLEMFLKIHNWLNSSRIRFLLLN